MDAPRWEPEPLYLPIDEMQRDAPRRRDDQSVDDQDDLGNHVIIIDIA